MFIERVNHATGERVWAVAGDQFDFTQEIARSRFGDMLLDFDRNDRYESALINVIRDLKSRGEFVHVLDIGTGTGLLSLMAARAGADKVTALEVFRPMAECAKKIINESLWKDIIEVVACRSTDIPTVPNNDAASMRKPNVLVAEVFDTELIGEGALRTFKGALDTLVEPGCRVIPSSSKVWVTPVESNFLDMFNRIPRPSEAIAPFECPGSSTVHDVQLSQMPANSFRCLSKPILAFSFNYESSSAMSFNEHFEREVAIEGTGTVHAFLMWWECDMDGTGKNILNMAPTWYHSQSKWRDHWMQAIYYPSAPLHVEANSTVKFVAVHDEFSMWFDIRRTGIGERETADIGISKTMMRPYCSCFIHSLLSRCSLYRQNELMTDTHFLLQLKQACDGAQSAVILGEGSLLAIRASVLFKDVTVVDSNRHFRTVLQKYVEKYGLTHVKIVERPELVTKKPDVIIGEPFYLSSTLPWENLRFWFEAARIKSMFGGEKSDIQIFPQRCCIRTLPMQFENIQNTACRVGTVNGFDLSHFDNLSEKARSAVDALVEDHSLWEYDGRSSGNIVNCLELDLRNMPATTESTSNILLGPNSNGIALWAEWDFGSWKVSNGLVQQTLPINEKPEWWCGGKQGVYFLRKVSSTLHVQTHFDENDGIVTFCFST